jgi:hypothetical protein
VHSKTLARVVCTLRKPPFSRPFGTYSIWNRVPALKRRAIVRGSFGTKGALHSLIGIFKLSHSTGSFLRVKGYVFTQREERVDFKNPVFEVF